MPVKHGMAHTAMYKAWLVLVQRCTNPNCHKYPLYGGRGINLCPRWLDFANFYADMGERPEGMSLDRIDNDKGYEPGNCRWADAHTQANNTRRNKVVEWGGETKTWGEWARDTRCKVSAETLRCRVMQSAWDFGAALTTPNKR